MEEESGRLSVKRFRPGGLQMCLQHSQYVPCHCPSFLKKDFFLSDTAIIRTTLQVKTHAQLLMKKVKQGIYIFEELDEHVATNVTHTVPFGANETGTAQEISFRDEEINTEITAAAHSLIQMASSHIATTECQRL
jgi:hypothetical protein